MKKHLILLACLCLTLTQLRAQNKSAIITVEPFEKVIIAPHIRVVLEEGPREAVTIDSHKVPQEKINIEVKGHTLMVYLDDAKFTTKHNKTKENGQKRSLPVYQGTQVTAHINYKKLKDLSIRGEETIICKSPLKSDEFKCQLYGEAKLVLNDLQVKELRAVFYGDNVLEAEKGATESQVLKAYGESQIRLKNVYSAFTKITSYGASEFNINASNTIKIWAFGDADINYQGDAKIERIVSVGDININKSL